MILVKVAYNVAPNAEHMNKQDCAITEKTWLL